MKRLEGCVIIKGRVLEQTVVYGIRIRDKYNALLVRDADDYLDYTIVLDKNSEDYYKSFITVGDTILIKGKMVEDSSLKYHIIDNKKEVIKASYICI